MALKNIVIKDCKLQNLSTSQSKLDIVVYPMDENGDLEPGANLKVYINDSLAKNLTANEFGELQEGILINNVGDEIKVQIRDVSENIRSKIKIILKDNSNQSTANSTTQEIDSQQRSEHAKQETIAKLKADPSAIVRLNEEQKNDPDIVKYALMQKSFLYQSLWIQYTGNDIKNNEEMVEIAIKAAPNSFSYISDRLKTDTIFVLKLLKKFGNIFPLSDYTKNQKEIKEWLNLLDKEINIFNKNKNDLFGKIKSITGDYKIIKYEMEIYPGVNGNTGRLPNLKKLVDYLDSTIKKKDKHLSYIKDILNISNNLPSGSISWVERQNMINKISNLEGDITYLCLPYFVGNSSYQNEPKNYGEYWHIILQDFDEFKKYLKELESLLLHYKKLQTKYPFFVDKEIEQML